MRLSLTAPLHLESHDWLLERYWIFAGVVLAMALPLLALDGARADVLGFGVYAALTIGLFAASRVRFPMHFIRLHLFALVPYWAWYADLAGSLPMRVDAGVSTYVVLFFFPILVTIAIDGWRGVAAMAPLSFTLVASRFGLGLEGLAGWFLCGTAMAVGMVFRHQTSLLSRANEQLHHLATHDPETDLANRRLLDGAVKALGVRPATLFLVELCRFKTIEDGYGRDFALGLLREVGQRLVASAPEGTLLVFLGGDRFGLLAKGCTAEAAIGLAETLAEAAERAIPSAHGSIRMKSRVGVASWPHEGSGASGLIRRAERATDLARTQSARIMHYDPVQDPERERELEVELWRALAGKELLPHFQPIFELQRQKMVGVEALVRWKHPQRGLLGAMTFVGTAEVTGQIVYLDRMMLEQVVLQLEEWDAGGIDLWAAANVSARTLEDPSFLEWMRVLAMEHPLAKDRVVLEITESAAIRDPERSAELLRGLRALGFKAALDDFGMGHSSLAYLKRLPASHLKLDRSFVDGIGVDSGDVAILDLLVQLAKLFGLEVVAEGVERNEQLEWLQERGCDFAQGFLLARPMSASEVTVLASSPPPQLRPSVPPASDQPRGTV